MPDGTYGGFVTEGRLFDRLPPRIAAGLTVEQRDAISAAAGEDEWSRHPVNLRFGLPFIFGGVYVALVAGRERRGRHRRLNERRRNPLGSVGNVLFVGALAIVFYLAAVGAAMRF